MNPFVKSTLHAYMEASEHPQSLVRVTVPHDLEAFIVLEYLERMDSLHRLIDWKKSAEFEASDADSTLLMQIEFRNGSAIEVRGS